MRESTEALIAEYENLIADYENLIALMKQEDGVTAFECCTKKSNEWRNCICPQWPFWKVTHTSFRVKPKPVDSGTGKKDSSTGEWQ